MALNVSHITSPSGKEIEVKAAEYANVAKTASNVHEGDITWGGADTVDSIPCYALPLIAPGNGFGYLPAAAITIEYSRDAGATWVDYGATDAAKVGLFTEGCHVNFVIGKGDSTNPAAASSDYQLRVTIDRTKAPSLYISIKRLAIYMSSNGNTNTRVETQIMYRSATEFTAYKTYRLVGWSGWNWLYFPVIFGTYADNQAKQIRFIFKGDKATNSSFAKNTGYEVYQIYAFTDNQWGSSYSPWNKYGRLYQNDANKNAIFPAGVYATGFHGIFYGNATSADSAKYADYPSGFASRSNSILWGTLTPSNGYDYITRWDTAGMGSIAFAQKAGGSDHRLSMQLDGDIYVQEGHNKVATESYVQTQIPVKCGTTKSCSYAS